LSSLDISSLERFFERTAVCLGPALVMETVGDFGAVALVMVWAGATARVLRVAGAGAGAFLGAAALVGAAFAGAVFAAGREGAISSTSDTWRFGAGTRLMRRSRRDLMLAHWVSHMARNLSSLALTVKASAMALKVEKERPTLHAEIGNHGGFGLLCEFDAVHCYCGKQRVEDVFLTSREEVEAW
jgi:hypothetical protein